MSPLFLLIVLIVAFTVYSVDSSHQDTSLSLTVAFMISSIYAVAISGGMPVRKRVDTYSKGAGANNLMLMLWIYVLAGSFAASAKAMGAVDATVNLALSILPASMILPGLFLAACFISVSIGTSVGTVVALVPIAAGLAHSMDANVGMMTAIIVGGAYFGDNLSFISDTTVVATQTQNCKMSDKFKVNSMIVVPAAVLVLIAYSVMGIGLQAPTHINEVEYMKVLPYLIVLITAIAGMNVMAVLTLGTLLCGAIGIGSHLLGASGSYDLFGWFSAMGNGIIGMGELIIIAMMAGGMLEIIRENGGIDFIINKITAHVNSQAWSRTFYRRPRFDGKHLYSQQHGSDSDSRKYFEKDRRPVWRRQPQGSQHSRHLLVHGSGIDSLWRADAPGSRSGQSQSDGHSSLSLLSAGDRCGSPAGHPLALS